MRLLAPVRELRSRSFRLWRNEDRIRKNSGNHIICHQKERSTTKSETPSFSIKQNGSIYSQRQERKLSASNGNHPPNSLINGTYANTSVKQLIRMRRFY